MMQLKQKKGFTLIELLVVVLIVSVLSAVVLPQYRLAVAKSRAVELLMLARHFQQQCADALLTDTDCSLENMNWEYPVKNHSVSDTQELWSSQGYTFQKAKGGGTTLYGKDSIILYVNPGQITCYSNKSFGKKLCAALSGRAPYSDGGEGQHSFYTIME